jgi:hypothetical protein
MLVVAASIDAAPPYFPSPFLRVAMGVVDGNMRSPLSTPWNPLSKEK